MTATVKLPVAGSLDLDDGALDLVRDRLSGLGRR